MSEFLEVPIQSKMIFFKRTDDYENPSTSRYVQTRKLASIGHRPWVKLASGGHRPRVNYSII